MICWADAVDTFTLVYAEMGLMTASSFFAIFCRGHLF
jgi:hypothetical protein